MKNKWKIILASVLGLLIILFVVIAIYKIFIEINFIDLTYDEFVINFKENAKNNNIILKENLLGEKVKEKLYRLEISEDVIMYLETTDNNYITSINYTFKENDVSDDKLRNAVLPTIITIVKENDINKSEQILKKLLDKENLINSDTKLYNSFFLKKMYFFRVIEQDSTSISITNTN